MPRPPTLGLLLALLVIVGIPALAIGWILSQDREDQWVLWVFAGFVLLVILGAMWADKKK